MGSEGRIDDVKRLDRIAVLAKELEVLVDDLGAGIYEDEMEEAVCFVHRAGSVEADNVTGRGTENVRGEGGRACGAAGIGQRWEGGQFHAVVPEVQGGVAGQRVISMHLNPLRNFSLTCRVSP